MLNEFETIKVCTGYSYQGQLLENFPRDPDVLRDCHPGLRRRSTAGRATSAERRSYDQLPAAARAYLKKLEEISGCPIVLVSVGPRRDQTIQLSSPFA